MLGVLVSPAGTGVHGLSFPMVSTPAEITALLARSDLVMATDREGTVGCRLRRMR